MASRRRHVREWEGGEEAEEVGEAMWLPTASRCHASFFFQGRTGGAEGDSAHQCESEEGDRRRWRKRGWWGLSPSGAVALARETAAWVVAFGEKQASSSALLAALAC